MSLTLTVDGPRWRAHLESVADAHPGIVPVAKGNGYGFTLGRLARKAQWLPTAATTSTTLAVGTYDEIARGRHPLGRRHPGADSVAAVRAAARPDERMANRVIHTVSRLDDLEQLLGARPRPARIVLERSPACSGTACPAATCGTAAEVLRRRTGRGGSRASRCTCRSPRATTSARSSRLLNDYVAAGLPDPHRLGQPPHRRRAHHGCASSTPTSPSARASAPSSGSATAARSG